MDSDPGNLVSSFRETNRYFSYGGDNILILPGRSAFISQFDNCLFAVPLPNRDPESPLLESLQDDLLDDPEISGELRREVLCVLDSNEENLYNGKKYRNKCVVTLGGVARFLVNPAGDQLTVLFSNNIMNVYSLQSDHSDWLYLDLQSSTKVNNNNRNISSACSSASDVCVGLMDGTVLVYKESRFSHSFRPYSSPVVLLRNFKNHGLFVCSKEGDVHLYDLERRVALAHLRDHTAYVKSLHYIVTKDNDVGLITLDNDNIVNLWSLTGSSVLPEGDPRNKENDLLVLVDKEQQVAPFKRLIKNENVVSVIVVTTAVNEEVDGRKKGSWLLLVVEESGLLYYQDPTDESILLKNEPMYGSGPLKCVEYSKDLLMVLSLNGTIAVYDHNFRLLKLLLSNLNYLFQFELLTHTTTPLDTKDKGGAEPVSDDGNEERGGQESEMELDNPFTNKDAPTSNYEFSKRWYKRQVKRGFQAPLMAVLIGDEVLRILSLNKLNEFIPLGLYNLDLTHKDVLTTMHYQKESNLLVSGSRDKLVILWDMSSLAPLRVLHTIHIVTSCLLVTTKFAASKIVDVVCSNDNMVNLYSVKMEPESAELGQHRFKPLEGNLSDELDKSSYTSVAHKSTINYVALSHNQKYIASCGNDKAIVVHQASNLIVKGRCLGHKKSVLYVKFMKLTKTLVSASMDQTIKIWSLSNFTNVKTLQGHSNSIMKVLVLENNLQLLSCALDGLVKLWNTPTSDCIQTLNDHENQQIWDIELDNNKLFSASHNLIVVCEDFSQELRKQKALQDRQEEVVTSEINALLLKDNYRDPLLLAIKMNNMKLTSSLLAKLGNKMLFDPSFRGTDDGTNGDVLDYVIDHIKSDAEEGGRLLRNMLGFIKSWVPNRHTYFVANALLNKLLKRFRMEELLKVEGLLETIDFLLHNLANHQSRLSALQEKSHLLDIIVRHNPMAALDTTVLNNVLYN